MSPSNGQTLALPPQAVLGALPESFVDIGCLVDERGRIVELLSETTTSVVEERPATEGDPDIRFVEPIERKVATILEMPPDEREHTFEVDVEMGVGRRWFQVCLAALDDTDHRSAAMVVVREVTDERAEQRRLQARSEEAWNAINASDDLFYVYGDDGTMRRWNEAVERVTGFSPAELESIEPTAFFPDSEAERVLETFATVFETGHGRIELPLETADGERIPYQFVATRAETPDGEPIICGIGRDISDRIEREQQIAVLSRVLRHNVRNKMTVVGGRAESLASHVPDSELESLAHIERAADDLVSLSEKSLDITHLLLEEPEPDRIVLEPEVETIATQVSQAYPDAAIRTDVDDDLTASAIPEIGRAIGELVENACEHNYRPTVRVTAERVDGEVRLTIADDGRGLPSNEANVITQSTPTTPLFHGVGMGLWLVRWIVKLSGGSIDYREENGGGACFEIRLDRTERAFAGDR